MGYTNYWYKNYFVDDAVFEGKYAELLPVARKIVELASVDWEGEISTDYMKINGVESESKEDFLWLTGKRADGFNMLMDLHTRFKIPSKFSRGFFACCKTARKDYDIIVVAILCAVQQIYGDSLVHVSSAVRASCEHALKTI